MKLAFHALTPDRWTDLEALFGPRGACGGCWCMYWRQTGPEYAAGKGEANRRAFAKIVRQGTQPGILAYADGEPVGWCAVEPRAAYKRLASSRTLKPVDGRPAWSVTCFFVKRAHRHQGLTVELLEAAKRHVRARGGDLLEGYPVAPAAGRLADAWAWTGFAGAFEKAGFAVVASPSKTRRIVRLALAGAKARGARRA